ncbi:MAG TPA: transglycosylase domain-containing protein, partial [Myxococcota bacterium]|nr:transglycosylase domain-containing protein [Myxococcota bacterium]
MKRPLRYFLLASLALLSFALLALAAVIWIALDDLPDVEALKHYKPAQSTIVFDRNGEPVGRFFDERRTVISLKDLPAHVKLAFIAAEDGDFFEHRGIDYFGLMRAVLLEIKHRTIGGRRVGGSTITQQTARTMLLSSNQTYVRKIKEIVLAQRIEETLSKEEILHLYLNQIYFGNGAYGIEEAAQTYFLKPASKLTVLEAATLACIPKSPNRINPFADAERLKQRQDYVLDQMLRLKFIEEKEA